MVKPDVAAITLAAQMRVMQEVMTKERFMLMSQGLLFIYDSHTYYHTITVTLEMTPLVLKKISEINFEEMDDLAASDRKSDPLF